VPLAEFQVDEMGVHPTQQRRGIGRALLEAWEKQLSGQDVQTI
jgi:ribosomal protein S18 acetylase RimI-like enzyme